MSRRRDHTHGNFTRGSITGGREATQKLKELGDDVLKAAKDALKQGVDMIVIDAKSRCPFSDDRYLPNRGLHAGQLMESIKSKAKSSGTVYELSANAKDNKGICYGQFVEFDPRIDKPFLYPAMDANREKVHQMIADAIRAACRRKQGS